MTDGDIINISRTRVVLQMPMLLPLAMAMTVRKTAAIQGWEGGCGAGRQAISRCVTMCCSVLVMAVIGDCLAFVKGHGGFGDGCGMMAFGGDVDSNDSVPMLNVVLDIKVL